MKDFTLYSTTDLQHVYKGYPARIGVLAKLPTNNTWKILENNNSGHWSVHDSDLNAYRVSEKVMQEHGRQGFLLHRLDDNVDSFVNPRLKCNAWYEVRTLHSDNVCNVNCLYGQGLLASI